MRAEKKTGFRRWWGFLGRHGPILVDRIQARFTFLVKGTQMLFSTLYMAAGQNLRNLGRR